MNNNIGIVLKSATRSRFPKLFPGVTWEWYIIEDPFKKVKPLPQKDQDQEEELSQASLAGYGAREVTKREALEYIEDNGLVLAMKTKDGEIYDLPGSPFQKEYHLDTKEKKEKIEKIWG